MKKFLLCNQDETELFETSEGHFTCAILELYDVFVVKVSAVDGEDIVTGTAGIYRDVQEAADAVAELKDFANQTQRTNATFTFPQSSEAVTAIEFVTKIDMQL